MELLAESLALSREVGSIRGTAVSLFGIGSMWRTQGDAGKALRFLEDALELFREAGDSALIASVLTHLGYTFLLKGDLDRAKAVNEEAAMMLRKQNHRTYLADALDNLGWVALLGGELAKAEALFKESLGLSREIGGMEAAYETLEGLTCVAGTLGKARRAARVFGAAQALREAMGFQQEPSKHALEAPYLSAARSLLDEASWEVAFAEGHAMSFDEALSYSLLGEERAGTPPSVTASPQPPPSPEHPAGLAAREVVSGASFSSAERTPLTSKIRFPGMPTRLIDAEVRCSIVPCGTPVATARSKASSEEARARTRVSLGVISGWEPT